MTAASGYPGDGYDGFVIGGGNDIDPAIYGGDVSLSRSVDPHRDQFELQVLDLAARLDLPVLGICRGSQLLNVHAGGTLYGDVSPMRELTSDRGTLLPRKAITIDPASILAQMLGSNASRVNSLHHQAVRDIASGYRVAAHDRDGIVQAIEAIGGPLRVGVQWHPEYMPQRADQRRLFEKFVAHCRTRDSL